MPRLSDHEPAWIDHAGRRGLGLLMTSPEKPDWRLCVLFANPLDGGPPWPGESRALLAALFPGDAGPDRPDSKGRRPGDVDDRGRHVMGCGTFRWRRTGDTFDALSLDPSVNAHQMGHFTVTRGGW